MAALSGAVAQYLEDLALLESADGYVRAPRGNRLLSARSWPMVQGLVARMSHFWASAGGRTVALMAEIIHIDMRPQGPATPHNNWSQELRDWEKRGVATVIAFVVISPFPRTKRPLDHAMLLLFDFRAKKYAVYDPNGNRHRFCCFVRDIRPALLRGHTGFCVQQSYPGFQKTLTHRCRDEGACATPVEPGICTTVCTLVAMCCMRLQLPDPFAIDNALCDYYRTDVPAQSREVFRRNLVRWSKKLMQKGTWEDIEGRVGLLDPIDEPHRRCHVYGVRTKRPCARRACDRHGLCWQHRIALLVVPERGRTQGCKRRIAWEKRAPPRGPWCADADCV